MAAAWLQGLVDGFAQAAGLGKLRVNEGRCAIRAGDRLSVIIEEAADGELVYFYARLAGIPAGGREAFYRRRARIGGAAERKQGDGDGRSRGVSDHRLSFPLKMVLERLAFYWD